MTPVPFKCTFRTKQLDHDGQEFLYKSRCVLRGDKQKAYIDFNPDNLFAPVVTQESLRMIIAISSSNYFKLEGADVINAYFYGKLGIPIIMEQPTNSTGIQEQPGMACVLNMSIYGSKQAVKILGGVIHGDLTSWGFKVFKFYPRLYLLKPNEEFFIILLVVDDMAFAKNSPHLLERIKAKLKATFDVEMYGHLQTFIRWEIIRSPAGIKLSQTNYAKRVLSKFDQSQFNAVMIPLAKNEETRSTLQTKIPLGKFQLNINRSIPGSISYLATSTRPYLTYSISILSRHLHNPCNRHLLLAKRVLKYISGTLSYGLHYPKQTIKDMRNFCATVYSDWGGDKDTRRSTTGYIIAINGAAVYWRSKRKTVISLSSGEAEYIALSTCAKDVTGFATYFGK